MRKRYVAFLWLVTACSNAKFSGQNPVRTEVEKEPESKSFELTCQGSLTTDVQLTPGAETTATLTGELCPAALGAATVLFVVDYSGSMGKHVPSGGGDLAPGNDPQANASCGRLQAAQAVMSRLVASSDANVKIGFVPFAGRVLEDRVIGLSTRAEFEKSVNAGTFCSYVVQGPSFGLNPDNPGGIQSLSVNSSTNYASAFAAAEALLASEPGSKTVYFISDGEPTSGGDDPAAAGIAAGESLRANVPELTLNGLLLGAEGARAKEVLTAVVGDQSRVRVATKASELANEIVKFPSVELAEATATLQRGDGEPEALALDSFAKKGEESIWSFVTAAFGLTAGAGETVPHRLTISAKTPAGQDVRAEATLNVRM